MNLSFAGCGFLGIYHVGVATCFKKYAPHLLLGKISGASFGAISACCLLCDLPIGELTSDVLRCVREARAGSLGPFSPSFSIQNILLEGMEKYLPPDVHKIVSGKLHISLTRVYDGQNVIVSEFATREDLLQALLASCFVPVFSGMLPPRFHGIRYMDGGFSDNLPVLDENTITVSPFCGESDICPRDVSSQLFHVNLANTSIELSKQNINRFARILFPPKPEVLSSMCKQGFDDALRFLHRNNMISCTRCLAVQTTYQLQDVLDDTREYDPECDECKTHRQDALVDDLPDTVMTIFQNAIDSANNGIVNWVMRQRGMQYISLLTLPYRVPIDVMYATFTKDAARNGIVNWVMRQRGMQYISLLTLPYRVPIDVMYATFTNGVVKWVMRQRGMQYISLLTLPYRVPIDVMYATFTNLISITNGLIDSANNGIVNWVMRQRGIQYISLLTLPYRVPIDVMYATFTKNNGIVNWVMRQRGMQYISLLTLPYRVPIDVMYATFTKGRKGAGKLTTYVKKNVQPHTISKFVTCTPKMSKSVWKLSLNIIQQLHGFLYSAHDKSDAAAQIYYKLTMDSNRTRSTTTWTGGEYQHGLLVFHSSKSDAAAQIYYKLTMDSNKDKEHYHLDRRRASEFRVSYNDNVTESDTFEHILSVTSQNDALLAYYYLDSDNKVKMTEIYDVTDADTEVVQSPVERDINQQLEFDNDWSAELIAEDDDLDPDALDSDDLADRNIFSDPESEWLQRSTSNSDLECDEQPESERPDRPSNSYSYVTYAE
ncbi:patatin-like phospholipase domain-containing protein [Phthorimaea operculella]|nr:patatin-like phospholipase domain-containing protein [Phthorimaea operculella]